MIQSSDSSSEDEDDIQDQNEDVVQPPQQQQAVTNNMETSPAPLAMEKQPSTASDNISIRSAIINTYDALSLSSTGSPKPFPRNLNSGRFRGAKPGDVISNSGSLPGSLPNINDSSAEFSEDNEHKMRLQLYVFVARCIAYPFNARQPTDMARRQSKVTKQNLVSIIERFSSFLEGKTNIIADEAFKNAVQSYTDSFLKCDRVAQMVRSGGYSSNDFREVFKANIEKRVRILPDIEGLSKETVLSSWMAKFDAIYRGDEDQKRNPSRLGPTTASELILSKEQLYEMFQTILGVKKFEHQILFNACQLNNQDEQAALIRRELTSRQKIGTNLSKENMPKFIHKNMVCCFVNHPLCFK